MFNKKGDGVNWAVIGLILGVVVLLLLIGFTIARFDAISGLLGGAEESASQFGP